MDGTSHDRHAGFALARPSALVPSPAAANPAPSGLVAPTSPSTIAMVTSAASLAAAQPAGHPFPVLVAETDRSIRSLLSHILTLEDYEVAVAGTAPDCLDYLAHHRGPHLLCVGIFFDAISDIGILPYLRGNPALRKRLGVMVSGAHFNLRRYGRRYARFVSATILLPLSATQAVAAFSRAETKLAARLKQPEE